MLDINNTSIEKYRRIFIITDLFYLRTPTSENCIWNIINRCDSDAKLRFVFIRPNKCTNKMSKQAKAQIRTT